MHGKPASATSQSSYDQLKISAAMVDLKDEAELSVANRIEAFVALTVGLANRGDHYIFGGLRCPDQTPKSEFAHAIARSFPDIYRFLRDGFGATPTARACGWQIATITETR